MFARHARRIFPANGAPAHTSKRTQDWLTRNIPHFWPKGTWPANSPLGPIENLWSIIQDKLNYMARPTNIQILENHQISAWRDISPDNNTVESPNNGHVGDMASVRCGELSASRRLLTIIIFVAS